MREEGCSNLRTAVQADGEDSTSAGWTVLLDALVVRRGRLRRMRDPRHRWVGAEEVRHRGCVSHVSLHPQWQCLHPTQREVPAPANISMSTCQIQTGWWSPHSERWFER